MAETCWNNVQRLKLWFFCHVFLWTVPNSDDDVLCWVVVTNAGKNCLSTWFKLAKNQGLQWPHEFRRPDDQWKCLELFTQLIITVYHQNHPWSSNGTSRMLQSDWLGDGPLCTSNFCSCHCFADRMLIAHQLVLHLHDGRSNHHYHNRNCYGGLLMVFQWHSMTIKWLPS